MTQSTLAARLAPAVLGTLLLAAPLACQATSPATPAAAHGHGAHGHGAAPAVTAKARAQLDAARRATASLATPEAARAAGYRPMFGNVPLQGEHYIRADLVAADRFDVEQPPILMFAPVDGRPTLVGVAYAYQRAADAPRPAGFDGAGDAWHEHAGLAWERGKSIVMMHAWFVEAPEGPFARYNPRLPYLAAGLTPPAAATLADSAGEARARELGFALALAAQRPLLFELLEQRAPGLRDLVRPHRQAIEAAIPRLAAAERAGDRAAYERHAAEAVTHARAAVERYRAVPHPLAARLVDRTVDEFMGRGHGVEEELDALLRGRR